MPDIAMCRDEACPLRDTCYRYTATPSRPYQSYAAFRYDPVEGCEYHYPNNHYRRHHDTTEATTRPQTDERSSAPL